MPLRVTVYIGLQRTDEAPTADRWREWLRRLMLGVRCGIRFESRPTAPAPSSPA